MIRTFISAALISLSFFGSYASAMMPMKASPEQIQQMLTPMPLAEAQQVMQGLIKAIKKQLTEDEYARLFLPGLGLAQSAVATILEASDRLLAKYPTLAKELFNNVDISMLMQKDKRGFTFLSGINNLQAIAHKIDTFVQYEILAIRKKLEQLAIEYVIKVNSNPIIFDACMENIKAAAHDYCDNNSISEETLAKSVITVFSADPKLDNLFAQLHKTLQASV